MAQIKTPDLGGINNSIEAVLYCKQHHMGAYLGGPVTKPIVQPKLEHTLPWLLPPFNTLPNPVWAWMKGYMIVYNEMSRILALNP